MNIKIMKIKLIVLTVCSSALFLAVAVFTQNHVPRKIVRLINCWVTQGPPRAPKDILLDPEMVPKHVKKEI